MPRSEGEDTGRTARATIPRVVVASAIEGVGALESEEADVKASAVRPQSKGASNQRTRH